MFKVKRPAGYVDLMIAFESRKRSASPYKDMPLNVSLPFSFIDYYKKLRVIVLHYYYYSIYVYDLCLYHMPTIFRGRL